MEVRRDTSVAAPENPLRTRTLVSEPVPIESGRCNPIANVEEPAIDVIVGKPLPALHVETASADRPPQPVETLRSARPDCHAWTWSEWENRAYGFGTLPFMYSACVIGWTSGPTLLTTA